MPDRPAESLRLTPLEARLTPAAYTVDAAFAPPAPDASAVYVQPDGQVVVASRTDIGPQINTVTLTRFSATGAPDATFGPGGSYKLPLAVADYRPVEIEPRAGGYAVLLASQNAVSVAAVPASGAAGATGASAFSVTTIPTPFRVQDADLAVLPDGGARVAVRAADSPVIETDVIAPSGQLDALAQRRFTPSLGGFSAVAGQPDRVRDVKIAPDGSVYVAVAAAGGQSGGVAKLRPDGTPDPSFDGDGVQSVAPATLANVSAEQLAVAPDGTVWVYGTSDDSLTPARGQTGVFTRLTPAGAFDPGFGTNGTATWAADGTDRVANDLLPRPQGDAILTGGRGTGPQATPLIARVSERGRSVEALTGPLDAQPGAVTAAALAPDGKSLVVARPAGLNRLLLPEFAPDPALPLAASPGARTPQSVAVFGPNAATAVVLAGQPDGKYSLDTGAAVPTGFNRGSGARVARADLDGDGKPDTIFASGPGAAEIEIVLATGQALSLFSPYEAAYKGGLFVVARDLDGDNKADLVVSPDQGGGAVVVVYSGAKLAAGQVGEAAQVARYYGVADRDFRGGAKVALGDISGDGRPDLVVAAGDGGGAARHRVGEPERARGRAENARRLLRVRPEFADRRQRRGRQLHRAGANRRRRGRRRRAARPHPGRQQRQRAARGGELLRVRPEPAPGRATRRDRRQRRRRGRVGHNERAETAGQITGIPARATRERDAEADARY